ncbi:esterase [Chryseobacterium sp. MYb264]|uniref:alpha/beta hydrolase n=1 Tax=Chryseobacterium sp. MYb264 TaxID=2745153 RepID=UPI002E153CA4|nr:esterase [Chryseobacterium sp. MYb264]
MIKTKHQFLSASLVTLLLFFFSFKMTTTSPSPHLQYLVRKPKTSSLNPPLIILLHGVGSNEKNMFSYTESLPDDFLIVSVRGPITLRENSYAWFQVQFIPEGSVINAQQAENSRIEIIRFIDDLKKVEQFDENNVYLAGFSQGGIMSYSVSLTAPEKIKGIAVMSGRLLPEVKPLIAKDSELQKLKIFISHGTHDSVLKFQYAVDAFDFLQSKHVQPQFHKYNEDHTINSSMLSDLNQWLTEK